LLESIDNIQPSSASLPILYIDSGRPWPPDA